MNMYSLTYIYPRYCYIPLPILIGVYIYIYRIISLINDDPALYTIRSSLQ